MTRRAGLEAWAKANAWAIICTICGSVAAIYSGYLTGQTTTSARLISLERDVTELRAELDDLNRIKVERGRFMGCAIRRLDQLNEALNLTPPCALEITE